MSAKNITTAAAIVGTICAVIQTWVAISNYRERRSTA